LFPYLCSSFLQGMRDVRASPPPIPKDAKRWAVNRAPTEAQKKKDAEEAKRTRKILEHKVLEKRRRQQRHDGLPVKASPLPSRSTNASNGDDKSEIGQGPLDHLPDVGETAPEASVSSLMPYRGSRGHRSLARAGRHRWIQRPCHHRRHRRCKGGSQCQSGCIPARGKRFFGRVVASHICSSVVC
jgi:hypothetical protein